MYEGCANKIVTKEGRLKFVLFLPNNLTSTFFFYPEHANKQSCKLHSI